MTALPASSRYLHYRYRSSETKRTETKRNERWNSRCDDDNNDMRYGSDNDDDDNDGDDEDSQRWMARLSSWREATGWRPAGMAAASSPCCR